METMQERIEMLGIKLKVLESRILYLQTITDDVLNKVESTYKDQIKELQQKRQEAQQKLIKMKEVENKECEDQVLE